MAALETCAPGGVQTPSPAFDLNSVRETFEWPRDQVAVLVRMHGETAPFSEIGRTIRKTKNACIGKARRLGLPERDRHECAVNHRKGMMIGKPKSARKRRRKPLPPRPNRDDLRHTARAALAGALALPPMAGGRISDLTKTQCRWPIGDPKASDFGFCGRLKPDGGPYCTAHAAAAINPHSTAKARDRDRRLTKDLRRFA